MGFPANFQTDIARYSVGKQIDVAYLFGAQFLHQPVDGLIGKLLGVDALLALEELYQLSAKDLIFFCGPASVTIEHGKKPCKFLSRQLIHTLSRSFARHLVLATPPQLTTALAVRNPPNSRANSSAFASTFPSALAAVLPPVVNCL